MLLYRFEDRFDQKTGKKLEPVRVANGVICDFTGKEARYTEDLGPSYDIDYSSLDPCCGCRDNEYDFSQKWKIDVHSFLLGSSFIFDEYSGGKSILLRMIDEYKEWKKEEYEEDVEVGVYIDSVFRWARIKTADALLESGKYSREELGMEVADWMDEDEED